MSRACTGACRWACIGACRSLAVLALLALLAGAARAQPLEPPSEAPEGIDYAIETSDTLDDGAIELGVGASGRAGSAPARRRRVQFSGDDLSGAVRDGSGDPLAGGSVEGRSDLGLFSVGRLAPRWGRGLLLGSAGDPWQREALDRGSGAKYRGRAGDGVMLKRGRRNGVDALYGRFARRTLGGAQARYRALSLGALSDGRSTHQSSLGFTHGRGESELAMDRGGGWRTETLLERPLGLSAGPRDWIASLRVRAGTAGFASLAEPGRSGPARAIAAGLAGSVGGTRVSLLGALWRFRPGVPGSRAGLAAERSLAHHGALALGFEEQRGSRRDNEGATLASAAARSASLRQGWWGEWRGGEGVVSLGLRHESWGERPWARGVVRAVTSARLEAHGPAGFELGVTHTVFRVKRGESLYLPEIESDRLVLRALSGEGDHTRIEARSPFAGGRVRAALNLATLAAGDKRPQWTLDWTRRSRARRAGTR